MGQQPPSANARPLRADGRSLSHSPVANHWAGAGVSKAQTKVRDENDADHAVESRNKKGQTQTWRKKIRESIEKTEEKGGNVNVC